MANKLTDAAVRARFIKVYARTGSLAHSAAAASVDLVHARNFRRRHADFAAECTRAGTSTAPARRRWLPMTLRRRAAFIAALADAGSVLKACERSGVSDGTVYWLRRNDATFAADWADARDRALDRVEDKLFEASLNGFVETVEKEGVTTTRRTQRPAAMFKLLAMRRRPGRSGGRMVELTPALIASARTRYDAALRLAAETGELPPPPLATLPPPTVTAV